MGAKRTITSRPSAQPCYRPGTFRGDRAFTLIEITIAILILSVSLVTLLGLQSASVERALRDRNKQQAMLMARDILAFIESSTEPLQPQEKSGTVQEVLDGLGSTLPLDDSDKQRNGTFKADLKVESWEVQGVKEDALMRVHLRIFWSEAPTDSFEAVYFVPNQQGEDEEEG